MYSLYFEVVFILFVLYFKIFNTNFGFPITFMYNCWHVDLVPQKNESMHRIGWQDIVLVFLLEEPDNQ